jgi:hypothetical protein
MASIYNIPTTANQIRPENINHGANGQLVLDTAHYNNNRANELSYIEAIYRNPLSSVGYPSAIVDPSTLTRSGLYNQQNLAPTTSFMAKSQSNSKNIKNLLNLKFLNTKPKKVLCLVLSIVGLLILLTGATVTIIYGISKIDAVLY